MFRFSKMINSNAALINPENVVASASPACANGLIKMKLKLEDLDKTKKSLEKN